MVATFVQATAGTAVTSGKVATAQYGSNVTAGNLLVAVVKRRIPVSDPDGRIALAYVTDDQGNPWKQANEGVTGDAAAPFGANHFHGVDIWYCDRAVVGGVRPIVTATVQGFPNEVVNGLRVLVLEYANGAGGLECVETIGVHEVDGTTGSIVTRDSCSANDLLISVVGNNSSAFTVPSGWNSRLSDTSIGFCVADKLDSGAAGAQTAAWTGMTSNTLGYGLIVAFKPGGTRTANQPRCVRTQWRLEELGSAVPAGTAISPAFRSPAVGNTLILYTSPYVGNDVAAVNDDHGNTWRRLFDGGYDTTGDGHNSLWVCRRCIGPAATITLTATLVAGNSYLWNQTFWLLMEYVNLPADVDVLTAGNALMHAPSDHPTVATADPTSGLETLVLGFIGGAVNNFDGLKPDAGWQSRFLDSMACVGAVERLVTAPTVQTAGWSFNIVQPTSLFVITLGSPNPRRRAAYVAPALPRHRSR